MLPKKSIVTEKLYEHIYHEEINFFGNETVKV